MVDQGGQLEPTEGPHHSLWTYLRAALVYLYQVGGLNSPERFYLQVRLEVCLNDNIVGLINSIKHKEILVHCLLS